MGTLQVGQRQGSGPCLQGFLYLTNSKFKQALKNVALATSAKIQINSAHDAKFQILVQNGQHRCILRFRNKMAPGNFGSQGTCLAPTSATARQRDIKKNTIFPVSSGHGGHWARIGLYQYSHRNYKLDFTEYELVYCKGKALLFLAKDIETLFA